MGIFLVINGAGNGLWCGELERVSCATDRSPEKLSNAICSMPQINENLTSTLYICGGIIRSSYFVYENAIEIC